MQREQLFSRIRSTFRHVVSASKELNNKTAPKEMKSRRKSADKTIKLKLGMILESLWMDGRPTSTSQSSERNVN